MEQENSAKVWIDDPFKLLLRRKEFGWCDIITTGKAKMKVLSEPEQVLLEVNSKWWIVRMWRKFWGLRKYESVWKYTVKLIDDVD